MFLGKRNPPSFYDNMRVKATPVTSILFSSILMGGLILSMITFGMVASGVVAPLFGQRDTEYYFNYIDTYLKPYSLIIPITVTLATYLLGIWKLRASMGHLKLFGLLAGGGLAIPVATAVLHFSNYSAHPEDYIISPDKIKYFQVHGTGQKRATRDEIIRLSALRQRLIEAAADPTLRLSSVRYLDGLPSRENCSRFDLRKYTGLICVRYYVSGASKAGVSHTLEVNADAGLRAQQGTVDLLSLISTPKYHCSVRGILAPSLKDPNVTIQGQSLQFCMMRAAEAIAARGDYLRNVLSRFNESPPVPLEAVLVETVSSLVGADYDVLQPLSIKAGLISVTGALLVLAYFALFASFVIEGASDRSVRVLQSKSKKRRWMKRPAVKWRTVRRH